jgi:hypothetical protein
MKRLLLSTLALALFIAAGAEGAEKSAKEYFQSRYDGLTKAYLNKDVAGAAKYLADDYAAGTYQRPMNKKLTLEDLQHWDGRFRTSSRIVLGVVVNGAKATATVDTVTSGKITDKAGPHKIMIKARCMDTWEKHESGWQLKHSRVVHSATTVDGKPAGLGKMNHG